tara:strand:+ start:1218 stop:3182 length:1965 start_codon:yes stop_codon:yes gene_type:complete
VKKNFIGLDGFIWFIGVVEDRQDPYLIGRVRVRCFGHHTGNKIELPTEDLPWAQVMLPVTSAGISGIGQSPIGLVEGSHVFGFFRDGEARQEPIVMGSMPGYPGELGNTEKGFYSPVKGKDMATNPPEGMEYLDDSEDSNYPRWKNSPDTSQLATGLDYSFNPDLSKHVSIIEDAKYITDNLTNIGTAVVEPMALASQFISKGSSSLFGFVADIITSNVASALGSNILNTVGSSLSGFTSSITGGLEAITGISTEVVDGVVATSVDNTALLSGAGKTFLNAKAGITNALLPQTAIKTLGDPNGILKVDILSPINIAADTAKDIGLSFVGVDTDTGLFDFNVSSVDTLREIVAAPASADAINAFQKAEVALETASRGVTPQDLGVQTPIGLIETAENQTQAAIDSAKALASNASGGFASLIQVVDEVTGVTSAIVDDEFQDSLSAKGRFAGSAGINQKNTTTNAGRTKLMNSFIGSSGGVNDSWSMPNVPDLSDTYPHKHVFETESGHIMMYDDNFGNETIMQRHRTGTRYELAFDGSRIDSIVSDHIYGCTGTSYNVITEDKIVSIDGRCKLFINKSEVRNNHYDIVIGKGANVNIQVEQGDINMNALDGRINMNCAEDFNIICGGEFNIISKGDFSVNSGDDITLQGDKIFLN